MFFLLYMCKEIGFLGGCSNLFVKVECCRVIVVWFFGFFENVASFSVLVVGFREFCFIVGWKFWVILDVRVL